MQPLAEMLDLADDAGRAASSPPRSRRARRAPARVRARRHGGRPVLVCASGARRRRDGAVARLVGGGVAPGRSRSARGPRRGASAGASRATRASRRGRRQPRRDAAVNGVRASLVEGPAGVVTPARAHRRAAERALGGPGDPSPASSAPRTRSRGRARPAEPQTVVAAASGLTQAVRAEPGEGAAAVADAARARRSPARRSRARPQAIDREGFAPYVSGPRAGRERGQDLRLEAARCGACGRLVFPPRPLPPVRRAASPRPSGSPRDGHGPHAHARPRLPDADVDHHGRGRRWTAAAGSTGRSCRPGRSRSDERVRLVPRRLHRGGDVVQYFWKVKPCR